jgi:Arc/MetJ family transcription regulator
MVRTNIELEDDHVPVIMDRSGVHTKTEAVALALRHLSGQLMTRQESLAMRGAHARSGGRPAWVEYDRATGSPADRRAAELVAEGGPLVPVLMRSTPEPSPTPGRRICDEVAPFDAVTDFEAAARIHRRPRQSGVSPRGMIDCMIMAVALHRGLRRCGPLMSTWTGRRVSSVLRWSLLRCAGEVAGVVTARGTRWRSAAH